MWKIIGLIVLFGTRPDGLEPTDRLTPADWMGNPWGPAAYAARDAGKLPPIALSPEMTRWNAWGKRNLREGDIVFRRGDARLLRGFFPFSRFIANVSGSPFSHTGIVAIEKGEVYLYDMTKSGVRKQVLGVWVLDNVGPIGVKRLKPTLQDRVPKILAYCRDIYARQVPFDYDLGINDDELYCIEMTEKAYRSAGLKLSDPVRLAEMENADKFPICVFCFSTFSKLKLDQEVFFPGNNRHGLWSSPFLETIYAPNTTGPALASARRGEIPDDLDKKPISPKN